MHRRGRPPHPDILTPREWEVLTLVERGYSNEHIASALKITVSGVKFHVSEILGKLHARDREAAARWFRSRRPGAGLWIWLWRWLRPTPAHVGAALAMCLVATILASIGLGFWGIARGSRSVLPPEIVRTPDNLVMAQWMNNERWILALDFDAGRYVVVDRSYRAVFTLPNDLWDVRGSATGSRVIAVDGDGNLLGLWDARTGAKLATTTGGSATADPEFAVQRYEWTYFAAPRGYGFRNSSGRVISPAPSVLAGYCGARISPSGRFAVVRHTCNGPCRLVDVAGNKVLDEWNLEPLGDAPDDNCDVISWSPDEREILISNGVT